jgi:ArsR family transcriptional regulator
MTTEVLKGLAHPIRLGVLELLSEYEERTVTQLYEELGCSQSMMSQQVKILCQQKLVEIRKEGTQKHCRLANPDLTKLFDCMHRHLRQFLNFQD